MTSIRSSYITTIVQHITSLRSLLLLLLTQYFLEKPYQKDHIHVSFISKHKATNEKKLEKKPSHSSIRFHVARTQ